MKNELEKVLKPLYEELSQIDPAKEYCTFCAQWGRMYQKGGMLFVGRAVNDWKTTCRDVELLFKEGDENQIFAREDQMRWVENKVKDKNKKVCSDSAFLRVVRAVSQRILGIGDGWYDHIAYSNLYKLAPDCSNPSNSLCLKQENICYRIFRAEIEILQPKVVVMLAGAEWYNDFLYNLNNDKAPVLLDRVEIPYSDNKNFKIETYKIGDVIYIGSLHPQCKPEQPHIEGIVAAIKKAK